MTIISNNDKILLLDSIEIILCDLINSIDVASYHDYKFEKYIKDEIYTHFCHIDYEEFIEIYEENIESLYIKNNLLKKCYKSNHEKFDNYDEKNLSQVEKIQKIIQPEQKTEEWYKFRKNHITGSNAWKILFSDSAYNQLMYEKLEPYKKNDTSSLDDDTPFNWGHKYEPLSLKIYEYYNDVTVEEFGGIQHDSIKYLAASPDGIVISKKNNGRMLEIKNPISREITKIPKMEYYVQMQIQMEVCNLPDCDFVETKFIQYDNFYHFKNDKYKIEKGMIIVLMQKDKNKLIYKYSDLFINDENKLDLFVKDIYQEYKIDNNTLENDNYKWIKNIYWKLDTFSCIYVPRNKKWFNSIKDKFNSFWKNVEKELTEKDSYKKYSPKKKIKLEKDIINLNINES
tara:strand:+ start:313 stop:1509 length:1197 start_codon:yes stop_codon:yes gene_type:complete